jgi:hypothetical protein
MIGWTELIDRSHREVPIKVIREGSEIGDILQIRFDRQLQFLVMGLYD